MGTARVGHGCPHRPTRDEAAAPGTRNARGGLGCGAGLPGRCLSPGPPSDG